MILLRCIAPGCTPAWFRLQADPASKPAGSSAPLLHCPYCGNPAPLELLFAAAAGSTQVAHEVIWREGREPVASPSGRRTPMVRFANARPGDKAPPLIPPESERHDHTCPTCSTLYAVYVTRATCPRCGPA